MNYYTITNENKMFGEPNVYSFIECHVYYLEFKYKVSSIEIVRNGGNLFDESSFKINVAINVYC